MKHYKKWFPSFCVALLIILIPLFTLSTKKKTFDTLEEIPDTYTLEDAKKDGMVVYEDVSITSGQETWDDFLKKCDKKEEASVLLAFYYTIGDASHYSKELYEELKDEYPMLYIKELSFDGSEYTITWYEDEQRITNTYTYLVKYEGQPRSQTANFSDYVYYVLVNDNSVTWNDLEDGMLSSQYGAYIDYCKVYSKYTYK